MKKRILSFLLCMVLVVSMLPQVSFAASSVVAEGKCGTFISWELDKSGTLTLSGFGDMDDYYESGREAPWREYRDNIKYVKIDNVNGNIKSIGSYSFYGCVNLKNAEISNAMKSIGNAAFYGCVNLSNLVIPNGVRVGDAAFYNCTGLKYIVVIGVTTKFGEDVFANCNDLTFLCSKASEAYKYAIAQDIKCNTYKNVPSETLGISWVTDETNCLYAFESTTKYYLEETLEYKNSISKIVIFEGVTYIAKQAFYDFGGLRAVIVPESVTEIGEEAFYNCYSLKKITIPKSVTTIDSTAFGRCPATIVCYENSAAHKFALNNGMDYELIVENSVTNGGQKPTVTPAGKVEMNFYDVPSSVWYYGDLKSAFEAGLINGKTANEFKPNDNMTYAEAIKLAACLHQLDAQGKITLTNGNPWYQPYVDYCKSNGIIDRGYSYNAPASRAGYMMIFANALPYDKLAAINEIDDNAIPDVKVSDAYGSGVYKLYRAGVVGGSDTAHNCKPNDNIKRAEVATILSRMMFAEKRIKFTLKEKAAIDPTGLRLDYSKTTFTVGETAVWKASVYPEDANPKVTWSSSNTSVATVDQNGKVTAISPGEARITVITENGIKEAITVTVIK